MERLGDLSLILLEREGHPAPASAPFSARAPVWPRVVFPAFLLFGALNLIFEAAGPRESGSRSSGEEVPRNTTAGQ